jgi:acetolactate synthase-1/2/3 large subunit
MNGQELATAVQYGGQDIIVLLNNGMYGTIRMHQEREYPQHVSGSELQQSRLRGAGAGLWLCRGAHHPHRRVRARACWPRWQREQGTLIEVMLDPEVITTRGTEQALARSRV